MRCIGWRSLLALCVAVQLPVGCGDVPAGLATDPNSVATGATATDAAVVPNQLVVATRPGASEAALTELFADAGAIVSERLTELSVTLLAVEPTQRDGVRDSLATSPLVETVVDNRVIGLGDVPDDALYARQWHLSAIDAPGAWAVTTGSATVVVAVLDTGVDTAHPDLAATLRAGGNTHDGTSGWQDVAGHGTAVAGIIGAATNNAEGVAGIAGGTRIMPIRVTDEAGQATSWSLAAGIALAVSEGARVINVSFVPTHPDEALLVFREATRARIAGALVVFPVGNTGAPATWSGGDVGLFVGAVDPNEALAVFSTYGDIVDLVAPGVGILTTQRGGLYGASSGTSFAAPAVAGVAALVWAVNPQLRSTTVDGILRSTAVDLGAAGPDTTYGAGQVNAQAAVQLAQTIVEQPDSTAPVVSISSPQASAVVSGAVVVDVSVADVSDVQDVRVLVDGALVASDVVTPYSFSVDMSGVSVGTHSIKIVATDVFGNEGAQETALEVVGPADGDAPTVSVVAPAAGSTVRGVVTILADVRDDRAVERVEIYVDGRQIGTPAVGRATATIAYNWDTSPADVTAGSHTITVRAVDTGGNAGSASVQTTVAKWN